MRQVLVYGDSLSWGIVPGTRERFRFDRRWPGVMELALQQGGSSIRVIEDCLNGRRTVWDDPFKPGRNGLVGLEQRMEVNSPLALVVLMLGVNDFQSMHQNNAWLSAEGLRCLVGAVRRAPIEPGMPSPDILLVAPPRVREVGHASVIKFRDAEAKSEGHAAAVESVAEGESCDFFDAGSVISTSEVDGVHLDEEQHLALGAALAVEVAAILNRG